MSGVAGCQDQVGHVFLPAGRLPLLLSERAPDEFAYMVGQVNGERNGKGWDFVRY